MTLLFLAIQVMFSTLIASSILKKGFKETLLSVYGTWIILTLLFGIALVGNVMARLIFQGGAMVNEYPLPMSLGLVVSCLLLRRYLGKESKEGWIWFNSIGICSLVHALQHFN